MLLTHPSLAPSWPTGPMKLYSRQSRGPCKDRLRDSCRRPRGIMALSMNRNAAPAKYMSLDACRPRGAGSSGQRGRSRPRSTSSN
jgi:hypothetical protein